MVSCVEVGCSDGGKGVDGLLCFKYTSYMFMCSVTMGLNKNMIYYFLYWFLIILEICIHLRPSSKL